MQGGFVVSDGKVVGTAQAAAPTGGVKKAPPIVVAADVYTPHHGIWHDIEKGLEVAGEVALKTVFTIAAPGVPR